ncbi:GNAT family N-acetyltransferase [Caenimonas koreensis]|uniref:GNAT family N-acetyltransferase n=1 Tax=Caenimonas koreensis TaxID=367474 RepID=UPI003783764B
MGASVIRDVREADFDAIVALNLESEKFLSAMDLPRFRHLHSNCAYCRVVEGEAGVAAFLLAFRQGAAYDSENYRWFDERYPSFMYVDRVVVASQQQGKGLGAKLYDDLFAFARAAGVACVTCEFDVEPPNEISRRLHERYGFREVGMKRVAYADKRVSMQHAALALS